eukprot:10878050-Lingulodinium_polyedra.AAC.1
MPVLLCLATATWPLMPVPLMPVLLCLIQVATAAWPLLRCDHQLPLSHSSSNGRKAAYARAALPCNGHVAAYA